MRRANISPQMMKEKFKYEAADELASEETGRIGGIVAHRMRLNGEHNGD